MLWRFLKSCDRARRHAPLPPGDPVPATGAGESGR